MQFIFNGLDVSLTNSNMHFERVLLVLNTVKYHQVIDIFNHQIVALPAGAEPNLKSGLRYTKVDDGLWFYCCVIQPS